MIEDSINFPLSHASHEQDATWAQRHRAGIRDVAGVDADLKAGRKFDFFKGQGLRLDCIRVGKEEDSYERQKETERGLVRVITDDGELFLVVSDVQCVANIA